MFPDGAEDPCCDISCVDAEQADARSKLIQARTAESAGLYTVREAANGRIRTKKEVWLKCVQTALTQFNRIRYITPARGTHLGKFSHMPRVYACLLHFSRLRPTFRHIFFGLPLKPFNLQTISPDSKFPAHVRG